jgi:LPXTG-motif cell wall-anchored protein
MSLVRIIGIAIFAVGIILFVFGIQATQKVHEEVIEKVTGHYTDKTAWYIIGGVVFIVLGGGLIVRRQRR